MFLNKYTNIWEQYSFGLATKTYTLTSGPTHRNEVAGTSDPNAEDKNAKYRFTAGKAFFVSIYKFGWPLAFAAARFSVYMHLAQFLLQKFVQIAKLTFSRKYGIMYLQ